METKEKYYKMAEYCNTYLLISISLFPLVYFYVFLLTVA